jgi:hypothetical protein
MWVGSRFKLTRVAAKMALDGRDWCARPTSINRSVPGSLFLDEDKEIPFSSPLHVWRLS